MCYDKNMQLRNCVSVLTEYAIPQISIWIFARLAVK